MAFNREFVKESIKRRLGSSFVPVELTDEDIDNIMDSTLLLFSRYKPLIRHEAFKFENNGINTIELPEDVIGIQNVEMISAMSSALSSGLAIENAILSGAPIYFGVGDTMMDVAYLDYRRRWLKTVARELGSDPDYGIVKDPETGRWTVHTFSTGGALIDVTCAIEHNKELTSVAYEWQSWFLDYCIAEARCVVGDARGKFDRIPVAGTVMSMNGPALKSEGSQEKQRLLADLQNSRVDLYPRWA
jgi:hypothetical protein